MGGHMPKLIKNYDKLIFLYATVFPVIYAYIYVYIIKYNFKNLDTIFKPYH